MKKKQTPIEIMMQAAFKAELKALAKRQRLPHCPTCTCHEPKAKRDPLKGKKLNPLKRVK